MAPKFIETDAYRIRREYNARSYDMIVTYIPKGNRDKINAYTKEHNTSTSKMINNYFRDLLGMTEEEWRTNISMTAEIMEEKAKVKAEVRAKKKSETEAKKAKAKAEKDAMDPAERPKRGRPRKHPLPGTESAEEKPKRGRGRPRKTPVPSDANA